MLVWALNHARKDNSQLKTRIDVLEARLAETAIKQDQQTISQEDLGHWMVREPKRIGRVYAM